MAKSKITIIDTNSYKMLRFCRLFLVSHFQFSGIGKEMWRMEHSKKLLIASWTVAMCICAELFVACALRPADNILPLHAITSTVERTLQQLSCYGVVCVALLYRNSQGSVQECFRILHAVEQMFRQQRPLAVDAAPAAGALARAWRSTDQRARRLLVLLMLLSIGIFIFSDIETIYMSSGVSSDLVAEWVVLDCWCLTVMTLQGLAVEMQLTYMACSIGTRLRVLNGILYNFGHELKKSNTFGGGLTVGFPASTHTSYVSRELLKLCQVHEMLRRAIRCLNRAYNLPMVFSFGHKLINIICLASFVVMSGGPIAAGLSSTATITLSLILHCLWLIIIIESGHRITIQERDFIQQLGRQMWSSAAAVPGGCEAEAVWRHLQLSSKPLQMTVIDVFLVGRPLIYTIAGAVITYLIVFIQLQKEC